MKTQIAMYTDGACSDNANAEKRIGAYAYVVFAKTGDNNPVVSQIVASRFPEATNNRAELMALIEASKKALMYAKAIGATEVCATCYADANYVVKAFAEGWLSNWKRNGWRGSSRKPIENVDLWKEVDKHVSQFHSFMAVKVKGMHKGDKPKDIHEKWNQKVNEAAQKEAGSL